MRKLQSTGCLLAFAVLVVLGNWRLNRRIRHCPLGTLKSSIDRIDHPSNNLDPDIECMMLKNGNQVLRTLWTACFQWMADCISNSCKYCYHTDYWLNMHLQLTPFVDKNQRYKTPTWGIVRLLYRQCFVNSKLQTAMCRSTELTAPSIAIN